jgi:hypothetical protein
VDGKGAGKAGGRAFSQPENPATTGEETVSSLKRKASLVVAGVAIAGGAVAFTGSPAMAAISAPGPCTSVWLDSAGSGGAQRLHVKCPGYYVKVNVSCSKGSPINGDWRWGYQKAECRNGARITSGKAWIS